MSQSTKLPCQAPGYMASSQRQLNRFSVEVDLGKLLLHLHTVCRSFFFKVYFALEQKSIGIVPPKRLTVPKFSFPIEMHSLLGRSVLGLCVAHTRRV